MKNETGRREHQTVVMSGHYGLMRLMSIRTGTPWEKEISDLEEQYGTGLVREAYLQTGQRGSYVLERTLKQWHESNITLEDFRADAAGKPSGSDLSGLCSAAICICGKIRRELARSGMQDGGEQ